MANTPSIFAFDSAALRVVRDEAGAPWFNAGDLCAVLGFSNPRDAISNHVDADDVAKRDIIDNLGRTQSVNHVNESGMYALIFGSTKPEAKKVKRWVTSEVLPSIRKTGEYAMRRPASTDFSKAKVITQATRLFQSTQRAHAGLSIRQSYLLAVSAAQEATGVDLLAVWKLDPATLPDVSPQAAVARLPKKDGKRGLLDKLARCLRNAKHLPVPRQASKITGEVIARLLGQGYIPRQMLLKVMHVPAAEFNLLIAEGKEAGIVRELDGIEFNYAGTVYVAGGAA